jgi:hypothetical protein
MQRGRTTGNCFCVDVERRRRKEEEEEEGGAAVEVWVGRDVRG